MSLQRSRERITEARVSPPRAAQNYGVPASPDNGQKHLPPTAPPRWKFAVAVWLAIYPSLTLVLWLVGPTIAGWPLALRTLGVTALLVPWMVFLILPVLQRLLASWLQRTRNR
jgi:antibiotic biosynthesis monooxygenase (ABM) superfamily enzyme